MKPLARKFIAAVTCSGFAMMGGVLGKQMEKNKWRDDIAEARELANVMVNQETEEQPAHIETLCEQMSTGTSDAIGNTVTHIRFGYIFNNPKNAFGYDRKTYDCYRSDQAAPFDCRKVR